MSESIQKIENILKSEYSIQNYVDFVKEVFDSINLIAPNKFNKEYSNFSSHIEGYSHIGNYQAPDDKKVAVFSVRLVSETYVENSRSTQRSYARSLIDAGNCDAAIIAFYSPNESKWRLSFVRLDYEMKVDNGHFKTTEKLTPAKRYSFLVGRDEPCHTAIARFRNFIIDKNYNPTLDEIEEAFSVEKVTKEFFELYCEKFQQLREQLEANKDFQIEAGQHNFTAVQFAKKLMGQIVFLYFLQKKGWMGVGAWPDTLDEKGFKNAYYARGAKSRELIPNVYKKISEDTYRISSHVLDKISDEDEEVLSQCVKGKAWGTGPRDFMRKLFNYAMKKEVNFYDDVLEPLFYDALNVNRGEQGYCAALHCRIPFLAGGLFEPIDGYDWKHNNFDLPNSIFSNVDEKGLREADGILDIFDRYNFTMSEDEPMEREVAIDPEMLGKVFENLLEVKDRKSKGAFYTPRRIVHYMCQESLIKYLTDKLDLSEEAVRDFILFGDFMKDEDTIKEKRLGNGDMFISKELFEVNSEGEIIHNRLDEIDRALKNVRIVDPAVGSGAFPLGMLNEIVRARQNISAYMSIAMSTYDKRMMYQLERSPHTLKYETIHNCIFAADIDPSAVDIAQLRLWLSLVIDDEINPDAQSILEGHRTPLPLPNLECNIVCGNSLTDEFEGIKLINESNLLGNKTYQISLNQEHCESIINNLIAKQDELYRCDNTEKKKVLIEAIKDLRDAVVLEQFEGCDEDKCNRFLKTRNLASKPYVLWQLDFARVFREKGGFDIVIGNPPYGAELDEGIKSVYRKKYTEVQFKIDSYVLFIIKGLELTSNGTLSYIIPNTLLNNYFLSDLRKRLVEEMCVNKLINFDNNVFDAVVHSLIIEISKTTPSVNTSTMMAWNINEKVYYQHQKRFLENEKNNFEFTNGKESLLTSLKEKAVRLETVLDLRQAIKTGDDKKYITKEPVGNAKHILRGKDVFRYRQNDPGLYINYGKHLACPRDENIFNQPHLLIREAGKTITATLDTRGYYIMSSLYCGILRDDSVSIEYMTGLINSKLFQYLMYRINFENTKGAFTKAKIYHYNQLPVIIPSDEQELIIKECVLEILKRNGADTEKLEKIIDQTVYSIYELSDDEIAEIESQEY